ncbi:MAG TPA: response regulator, partial [bacterium]
MPKVLIVDDEESNCKVISRILKKEGYETITAFNGREALEQFEKHNPDIVLLDIMMPEMDGYDACRQLKQKPQFIPVILITALDLPEHKIKGIQIGADDFINKPFNPEELKARIRNLLKTKSYYDKLNTSLNDLNLLVSYSEKTLNEFTPQTFSPTSSLSYLLTHLLRKESVPEYTGPQYILIGENKDGYSTGLLYWFDNYAIKTTAKPVSIKLISELAVGVPFSINLYEVQEREKWEKLFSKVFPQPLNILNFSTYVGEKMTIFGINY